MLSNILHKSKQTKSDLHSCPSFSYSSPTSPSHFLFSLSTLAKILNVSTLFSGHVGALQRPASPEPIPRSRTRAFRYRLAQGSETANSSLGSFVEATRLWDSGKGLCTLGNCRHHQLWWPEGKAVSHAAAIPCGQEGARCNKLCWSRDGGDPLQRIFYFIMTTQKAVIPYFLLSATIGSSCAPHLFATPPRSLKKVSLIPPELIPAKHKVIFPTSWACVFFTLPAAPSTTLLTHIWMFLICSPSTPLA